MIVIAAFTGLNASGKLSGASKYNRGNEVALFPEVGREVNREFGG